jgi:hypothetical protein
MIVRSAEGDLVSPIFDEEPEARNKVVVTLIL